MTSHLSMVFLLEESAALNLSHKLVWMSSRLRWINDSQKILKWTAAMESINLLLQGLKRSLRLDTDEGKVRWKLLVSNTRWGRKKAIFSRSGSLQVDVLEKPDSNL